MTQPKNLETTGLPGVALQQIAPVVRGVPAVLTSSGAVDNLVLIKSAELDQQLRQFLNAGIRYVEVTVFVEGLLLTFKASIVKRGPRLPLHLHPVGEAGKFLTELYQRRRATTGRKHNPVPLLILNVTPLLEKSNDDRRV
jgi:hypothetical protein